MFSYQFGVFWSLRTNISLSLRIRLSTDYHCIFASATKLVNSAFRHVIRIAFGIRGNVRALTSRFNWYFNILFKVGLFLPFFNAIKFFSVKQKFVYQDMLQKRSKICDEARAVETPKLKPKSTTSRPLLKLNDEKRNETLAGCDCNSTDVNVRSKCNCPSFVGTDTLSQAPIVSNEVERKFLWKFKHQLITLILESKKASSNWSLWLVIGLLVVLIQTGALIILYCKYRSKRRKAKKASVSLQMPKTASHSVINAYCPTLTDGYNEKGGQSRNGTLPLTNGTMRRGPMGEVSIQVGVLSVLIITHRF